MDSTEQTPLVALSHGRKVSTERRVSAYQTIKTYIAIGLYLFLFALIIQYIRNGMPDPLSDKEALAKNEFSGLHAFDEYLTMFKEPHSMNTRELQKIKHLISSHVLEIQEQGRLHGVSVDVVTNDTTYLNEYAHRSTPGTMIFINSKNIILRINGKSKDAILVNAHYDSVPTSPGVTDDGIGVAVGLELARYFVRKSPQHSMIFLFNAYEEGGLLGSSAFVKHPWFKNVRSFINLEGAGAGGRALIFRSSDIQALRSFSASSSAFPHASSVGNDLFKMGIIKSDTDYSIFSAQGIPGIDLAFYQRRSHYHTIRDDIAHTSPKSVQHMGQMVLHGLRNMDKDMHGSSEPVPLVMFDILGRILVVQSFKSYMIIHCITLFVIPTLVLATVFYLKGPAAVYYLSQAVLRGFLVSLLGLGGTFLGIGPLSFLLQTMNPMVTYGSIYIVSLAFFVTLCFGLVFSQTLISHLSKCIDLSQFDFRTALLGLLGLWWILGVFATLLGLKKIALMYYAVYLVISAYISFGLYQLIPKSSRLHLPIVFVTQTFVPCLILIEIWYVTLESSRHITVDGSPEVSVYITLALPILLIVLHLLPWVHRASNKSQSALSFGSLALLLLIVCCILSPFNSGDSPNKLVYHEFYNATANVTTVEIISATGLQQTLENALPPKDTDIRCTNHLTYQTKCLYTSPDIPLYGQRGNKEYTWSLNTTCTETECHTQGSYTAQNSILCRVTINQGTALPMTRVWVNNRVFDGSNVTSLTIHSGDYGQPVSWKAEYPPNTPFPVRLSCFYDEWTQGEMPAFVSLQNHLPDSAVLLTRGHSMLEVDYATLDG
ncbi:hypothetical protein BDF14DRAFT_1803276 [Spinellus fusiger]|nr:hypothetical protein BDF14DRAFT_1803276 [Spinellus fusiger]